jgi:uncharacterized protein
MLAGESVTAAQRTIIGDRQARMRAAFREEVSWESLEPAMLDRYARTLNQRHVDGALVCCQSDAGKAVTAGMPLLMQSTMQAVPGRMGELQGRLQQVQRAPTRTGN